MKEISFLLVDTPGAVNAMLEALGGEHRSGPIWRRARTIISAAGIELRGQWVVAAGEIERIALDIDQKSERLAITTRDGVTRYVELTRGLQKALRRLYPSDEKGRPMCGRPFVASGRRI